MEIARSLIGREVRVIFEDPGEEGPQRGKVWRGVLTNVEDGFIELTNDGHKSYVSVNWIIALMERDSRE